jgi:hypothetical protein
MAETYQPSGSGAKRDRNGLKTSSEPTFRSPNSEDLVAEYKP